MNPGAVNWAPLYETASKQQKSAASESAGGAAGSSPDSRKSIVPTVCDVGSGFGGLLLKLSEVLPNDRLIGLEIRPAAVRITNERIQEARKEGRASNIAVLRCNVMKHFAHYFSRGQLRKMFFTFPDPHFKNSNFRRRIISEVFLAYYAFALCEDGLLYTITDVKDLHDWMVAHLDACPLFERVPEEDLKNDLCLKAITYETDEAKKVDRLGGNKYPAVYRRITSSGTSSSTQSKRS